jgi:hypothetical protein|nr:MAG TPA: YycJ-like MBL-fold protein [Caudoviricetes sp.]
MELKVLGSGSKGNAYLLRADNGETLMIECGLPFKEIMRGVGFSVSSVVGCLISHSHSDHSFAIHDVLKYGIKVLAIENVFTAKNVKNRAFCKTIEPMHGYIVGGFKVFVLNMAHDVPCVGFIIDHAEMGRLFFATDTMMVEYKLPKLNHILIEANYADEILQENIDNGIVPAAMRERLLHSHMELQTCKAALGVNDLSAVNEIVLLHLSGNNSDPKDFKKQVEEATGKPVYVARHGLNITVNLNPY